MAQRKAHEKLDPPQAEGKKMHPAPDKLNLSSSTQQHVSKKKEIPRPRGDSSWHEKSPSTSQSPHYMKPTSCSDARKERVRVQFSAPKTPKTCIDNDLSPSTSSPISKSLKTLARKASLRPRRPSMKKISAANALSPRKRVTRATCSSTMKDFKFPNAQHLDPRVKRAELSSIVKVCPFGYCSMYGRRHHHLKRLPSVRRRSLKTQASMKLKRLPSHRKNFRKGRRSIASGKIKRSHGSKMAPVINEVSDDFSVEIDATPQENYLEHRCKGNELEREISKILYNLDSIENDEYIEEGSEEFDGAMTLIEIPDIYSRISFGDNLDQSSDVSLDDLYGDSCFPAYEAKEETILCFHENQGRWIYDCCGVSATDDRNTNLDDSDDNRSIGVTHMDDEEEARSFGGSESESAESSYGSEENRDERGSFTIVYDEEAAGLFAGRKIKCSESFDELALSVGILESDNSIVDGVLVAQKCSSVMNPDEEVPESDLIFPSDAAVLEKNGHCSGHGEEGSTIKVQQIVNLEASNNRGDQILNLLADVFIQSDSAEETILGDSLVIQGSGLSNEEISDLIRGNYQNSDVHQICIQLNRSYEFSDILKMEASELVELDEPNLVRVNSVEAVAADEKSGNDNVISVLERINYQPMNFEESDLATRVERPENAIHSNSVGGGGNKSENCNSFGRKKYEPDDTDASELGYVTLRINADNAEIGGGKVEGNYINACVNEASALPTHGECLDNLNISVVVENENSGSGKCEENIISSELPNPNNINLSILADEKASGLIEESELGNMNRIIDAEIIEGKDGHNANAFRSEKSEVGDLQESELDGSDECPENINFRIISENDEGKSGKPEENNISFARKWSKQDLEQAEFATDDDRSDTINLSIVADDVETGDNKNEQNSNDYNCKISDQGDIKELILGAEDNEAGDGNAEARNSICIASERSKQDHEGSELSTDNERPEKICRTRSINETPEPYDCEDSESRTGDENHDNHLRISKEDMIGFGIVKKYDLIETQFPAHHSEVFNVHQNDIVGDLIEPQLKTENCFSRGVMEHPRIPSEIPDSCSIDLIEESKSEYNQMPKICSEESKCVQSLQTFKIYNKQKSRHRSLNRRKNLEMEMLRLINPRAPRLLPLNPDPDGEKIDLRHQEVDEGRKPEDWMIDCALQKLVKKLAPDRKKKVPLLVEAFEAVVPEAICESTLMSPTSGFGLPLQACS